MTSKEASAIVFRAKQIEAEVTYTEQKKHQLRQANILSPKDVIKTLSIKQDPNELVQQALSNTNTATLSLQALGRATLNSAIQSETSATDLVNSLDRSIVKQPSTFINQNLQNKINLPQVTFGTNNLSSAQRKSLDKLLQTRTQTLSTLNELKTKNINDIDQTASKNIITEHLKSINTQQIVIAAESLTKTK